MDGSSEEMDTVSMLPSIRPHRSKQQNEFSGFNPRGSHTDFLKQQRENCRSSIVQFHTLQQLQSRPPNFTLCIRDGSYTVTNSITEQTEGESTGRAKQKIKTVETESFLFKLKNFIVGCAKGQVRPHKQQVVIMDQVNVAFTPGKMYLVLGAPGCGKSTLLKMIANNLHTSPNHVVGGTVSLASVAANDPGVYWSNLVGYIDQIDRHYPYLTVQETAEFAWRCRTGGTHRLPYFDNTSPQVDARIAKMDAQAFTVRKILDILGLSLVRDTFVGDASTVRGVSGGERKRVTVAEMLVMTAPVLCCDEISTGLDSATTYDITLALAAATRITKSIKIVSLLQPPPETVGNFDELIVLSEGKIIYFGPVEDVVDHFNRLGYVIPDRMDVADWLQVISTKEGWIYLQDVDGKDPEAGKARHLTPEQFRERFHESELGKRLMDQVQGQPDMAARDMILKMAETKFHNSSIQSLKLVMQRELLLFWRDKPAIKAKVLQNTIMGIVVGTLYFQSSSPQDLVGAIFQTMFFSAIGAMSPVLAQFPARSVFYKQQDAHFFPTWTYVTARSFAAIPFGLLDALYFGSLVYFFVGLALHEGDASVANYFIFLVILFTASWTSGLFFSIFPACVRTISAAQGLIAASAILPVLFCGFTVQPDVIPAYYIWIYWINYFSWLFRGLVVNEFDSGRYNLLVTTGTGEIITQGEAILIQFGFVDRDDMPFTLVWAVWGILFALGSAIAACFLSVVLLSRIRYATGQSLVTDAGSVEPHGFADESFSQVNIPFKKVDLTFKDIRYTVAASTTDEKLELLKGIDGVVQAGKLTALMGSSGAGKTTLLDVLAMRKSTGEVTGEVCLNGHLQDEKPFRRCMGYVEQFDTQSPELTIRETCDFSAKLRLDEKDPAVTPENIQMFVDQTLAMLELTNIQDLQVGSDEAGGLSFGQRKRLSIAVELVANVSILFADEPTSGLDASAACVVMRGLKRIAQSGRAVCCTIHQPTIAIFNNFDDLLLLQRGEAVYFGELGIQSASLIRYFESFESTPWIQPGENPATWMLTTIGAGSSTTNKKLFDYAGSYSKSTLREECINRIDRICAERSEDKTIRFATKYAASYGTQSAAVYSRAMTVYWRAPSYNATRVTVAILVSVIFGTVFVSQRVPKSEADMNSRINSIFMSVLCLCVCSQNMVLKVFETERNMFYRHKNAKMYSTRSIIRAFTLAEIPFIILTSTAYTVIFYFFLGFAAEADKFFVFYLFVTLALASFTMVGQMLMSLFKNTQTAQGYGSLFIGMTSLFSGILIRPNNIPSFWLFLYYITPGHYIFEALFTSQFNGDDSPIVASTGSLFYTFLGCSGDAECVGTANQWIEASFPDFSVDNIKWSLLYLVTLLIMSRAIAFIALTSITYRAT